MEMNEGHRDKTYCSVCNVSVNVNLNASLSQGFNALNVTKVLNFRIAKLQIKMKSP